MCKFIALWKALIQNFINFSTVVAAHFDKLDF